MLRDVEGCEQVLQMTARYDVLNLKVYSMCVGG